jgi:hypothetical protein
MGLNAKTAPSPSGGGVEQPLLAVGGYPGRVVQIIDLGVQPQKPWKGKEKPPAHMMMVTYEFADEFCVDEDGKELEDKPRWLSEDFALFSLDSDLATSTKRYRVFDPEEKFEGEFTLCLEAPVLITVTHNKKGDKTYTNVGDIGPLRPKEIDKLPPLVNPSRCFLLDEPDLEVFNNLPNWIREKITSALNFKGSALDVALNGAPAAQDQEPTEEQHEEEVPATDWDE